MSLYYVDAVRKLRHANGVRLHAYRQSMRAACAADNRQGATVAVMFICAEGKGGLENEATRSSPSHPLRFVAFQATAALKVMISGAPAAGKGTQCAKIIDKVGRLFGPGLRESHVLTLLPFRSGVST